MRPPRFCGLALAMTLFFAAGHVAYALVIFFSQSDPSALEKIETSRQVAPFLLDILLVAGVYLVGLLAAGLKTTPNILSRKRQYSVLCLLLIIFLILMCWRTGQDPKAAYIMRRHVFMAVVFALLGLYNKRHFSLTKEEEEAYGK